MSRIVLIVKFLFFGYNIDYRKSDFKFTFLMFMAARQFHWHEIRRRRRKARAGKNSFPPNPLPFCPPERSVWRAKRAVSSVQKRFGFRQTNAPVLNFQKFCQRILPREARPISSGKFPKVKFWCVCLTKSEPILPARQSPKGDGGNGTDGALPAFAKA